MAGRHNQEDSFNQSKLPCNVCEKSSKTNSICLKCQKAHCLQHSSFFSTESSERICDDCLELHLMSDLPDSETTVEAISEEIQKIVNQREENTINLCKLSASFMHKKNELDSNLQELRNKEQELIKEKSETEAKIKELEVSNDKRLKELESNKNSIKIARSKHEENLKQIESNTERLKAFTRERNIVNGELNELREFVKLQVPVRLVKRIVCASCFSRVLSKYHELFKGGNSSAAEIRKPSIQQPQKKTGACNSCEVF